MPRLIVRERIADQVRTANGTCSDRVGIGLIEAAADGRSEVGAGLQESDRVEAPTPVWSKNSNGLKYRSSGFLHRLHFRIGFFDPVLLAPAARESR